MERGYFLARWGHTGTALSGTDPWAALPSIEAEPTDHLGHIVDLMDAIGECIRACNCTARPPKLAELPYVLFKEPSGAFGTRDDAKSRFPVSLSKRQLHPKRQRTSGREAAFFGLTGTLFTLLGIPSLVTLSVAIGMGLLAGGLMHNGQQTLWTRFQIASRAETATGTNIGVGSREVKEVGRKSADFFVYTKCKARFLKG